MNIYENITYGMKVMKKPYGKLSNKYYKQLEEVNNDAIKKSYENLRNLKIDQHKILLDIAKLERKYSFHEEINNLKWMRHAQFVMKTNKLISSIKRKYNEKYVFSLSLKNK
jgi:hypothetical protein